MAGHSKWANIKHKKAATDAKRGKIWTRLIKEITVAARMGGEDIASNPRLRLAVDKAADANMPKENVTRAIQRGAGTLEGANYEEVRYEGYGIGGAAVIVECMTDNRVRTVAEVRHAFTKHGGNLGTDGSVAFLFTHCGQMIFAPGTDEAALMDAAIEAGADDVIEEDDELVVYTVSNQLDAVRKALIAAGYEIADAELAYVPKDTVVLSDAKTAQQVLKIMDLLEDHDDITGTYSNFDIDPALEDQLL